MKVKNLFLFTSSSTRKHVQTWFPSLVLQFSSMGCARDALVEYSAIMHLTFFQTASKLLTLIWVGFLEVRFEVGVAKLPPV